jgi:WD40 repeat protein/predicted acylesterase/phospholipase RssA/CRP-like cAMP-binding protein
MAADSHLALLAGCAVFVADSQRLAVPLQHLAELVVRRSLPKNVPLERWKRPLYFILSGEIRVGWGGGLLPFRTYGAGSVVGLESVSNWYAPLPLWSRAPVAVPTRDTEVLELSWSQFQRALGGSMQRPLMQHLLAAFDASERATQIVNVLASMPRLASASTRALYRLAESAIWIEGSAVSKRLAEEGTRSVTTYVLLKGTCEILRNNEVIAVYRAPTCIGLTECILRQPMPGTVRLVGGVLDQDFKAVRLSGEWLQGLRLESHEFDRAVRRGSRELAPPPEPPKPRQVVVLAATSKLADRAQALAPLLAEAIASSMYDNVLLLRLATGEGPTLAELSEKRRLDEETSGWVATAVWRPPPLSETQAVLLDRVRKDEVNVTLVDATRGSDGYAHVLACLRKEFVPGEASLKLLFLGEAPEEFPNISELGTESVELVPVAMLGARPATGLGLALFQARRDGANRRRYLAAALKALRATARQSRKALRDELRVWVRRPADQAGWPLGTTRVRFPKEWLPGKVPASFAGVGGPESDSLLRWARAATGRRVGLALGGGGALGYVHIALILRLLEEKIPIDLVSGSSFGAVVAAYYCGGDRDGLEVLREHWPLLLLTAMLGAISSYGVQLGVNVDLGFLDLMTLEVPFLPVVTDANVGVEADVRFGTVGSGTRASGSLPPVFGPSILGDKRVLDGGLVANVPIRVLQDECANLIIASNPIARVAPRTRSRLWLPVVTRLWSEFNPLLRLSDSLRMSVIMGRFAGENQKSGDNVVMYSAESTGTSMLSLMSFDRARMIVEQAFQSLEVSRAVSELRSRWYSMLNNPPLPYREVRGTPDGRVVRLELKEGVYFKGEDIDPISLPRLLLLAQVLASFGELQGFTVTATGPDARTASARAEKIALLLRESGRQQVETRAGDIVPGAISSVQLVELVGELVNRTPWELQNALRTKESELNALKQRAMAYLLAADARRLLSQGEGELARLLLLEAAQRGKWSQTAQALRTYLKVATRWHAAFGAGEDVFILAVAWSPDGRWLAVGTMDGEVLLLERATGNRIGVLGRGSVPAVDKLRWVQREQDLQLVVVGSDGAIAVWSVRIDEDSSDAERSRRSSLRMIVAKPDPVKRLPLSSVELSPDGRFVLVAYKVGGDSGNGGAKSLDLRIIDLDALVLLRTSIEGAEVAAWAPRGDRLACAGTAGVAVHEVRDGALSSSRVELAGGAATRVAWHPEGDRLAFAGEDGLVKIVPTTPGSASPPLSLDHASVTHLEWSPDGRDVLTVSGTDRTVRVWDGGSGRLKMVLPHERTCSGASWQPSQKNRGDDRRRIVTWNPEGAWLWDAESGACGLGLQSKNASPREVAWGPDGQDLVLADLKTVQFWVPGRSETLVLDSWCAPGDAPPKGPPAAPLEAAGGPTWYQGQQPLSLALPLAPGSSDWVCWSPDGQWAALVPGDQSAPLFWRSGESPPKGRGVADADTAERVAWSPDGRMLARWGLDGLSIWTPGRAEPVAHQPGVVTQATWTSKGTLLLTVHPDASALEKGWLQRWGPDFQQVPPVSLLEVFYLANWAATPDGRLLAVVAPDAQVVKVHDGETGKLLRDVTVSAQEQNQEEAAFSTPAWSPDGSLLAAVGRTRVFIWNSEGKNLLSSAQPKLSYIHALVWSRSGAYLFAAAYTPPYTRDPCPGLLWGRDASGGWGLHATLDNSPEAVGWAAFSADDSWLAVMGTDGKARLHRAGFEALVEWVEARPGRPELTTEEVTTYLGEARPLWKPARLKAHPAPG